jgi:Domain of unknown function (DUF222)
MFDTGLPGPEDLAGADDSLVIAAITGWACVEAAASARRLAAIAELVRRRAEGPTDCAQWSCDNWDSMAAEVAAALHVSHGMASGQMYLSVALRERLPKVAALFVEGMLSARLVAAIVWRTDLITDEAALGLVDKTLADEAIRFGPLSVVKTNEAIDAIIDQYDPAALRRTRAAARGRQVVIDSGHGRHGTTAFWGTLFSTDAAMLDRRLTQMASVSNWHGDSFVYIGAGYRGHRVPTHRWSTTWLASPQVRSPVASMHHDPPAVLRGDKTPGSAQTTPAPSKSPPTGTPRRRTDSGINPPHRNRRSG